MPEAIRALFVGLQWGDEGKAKVLDDKIQEAVQMNDKRRWVVRFQGGANAGHSMYIPVDGKLVSFAVHAAPSGLTSKSDVAIGPQVAFDPVKFSREVAEARALFGYGAGIHISERTGVSFDYHSKIDLWLEGLRAKKAGKEIGTTGSGIGPFYADNARRDTRITFADYVGDNFLDRIREVFESKDFEVSEALKFYEWRMKELESQGKPLPKTSLPITSNKQKYLEALIALHEPVRKELRDFRCRLEYRLNDALKNNEHIIIEGAQGALLDVDMGTIPDVTSSHLLAPHAFASLGLPREKFMVYGVEKIYPTRVGSGPMPTLADDDFGVETQRQGGEKGVTTGRPRRVGNPDWVLIDYTARINDIDAIILTRVDVVQDKTIKVCTAYDVNGEITREVPLNLHGVKPIYENRQYKWHLWDGPTDLSKPELVDEALRDKRKAYVEAGYAGLPEELQEYVGDHDEYIGKPTAGISIGPARGEMVKVKLPVGLQRS
jgi:adenylosuccinate synthase